jgi:hypothetical protein
MGERSVAEFVLGDKERGAWGRFVDRVMGAFGFAKVEAVPPGKPNDGMIPHYITGTELDRPWHEFHDMITDTREAIRKNPMVKRLVGMITAYTVGPGISMGSDIPAFNKFIQEFWGHEQNNMDIRVPQLSDELSRAGELFPVLFTNPVDGMSYIRTIPNDLIVEIDFDPNDYEKELRYREKTAPGEKEKWWYSPNHPKAGIKDDEGNYPAWVLHYAVNRQVGTIRGDSDLAPILPWIKRYEGWLADRVSLNAAMRAFYWVVYASQRIKASLIERYKTPPPKGSVIIAEEGAEKWEAVTPDLGARDAKEDGRAIRWMIVAGGLGTALADLGEGEEAGLKGGTDTSEQRRRFLLQRQRYFVFLLSDLLVKAYNRKLGIAPGRKLKAVTVGDVVCKPPDISADDNGSMAIAGKDVGVALQQLKQHVGDTPEFREMALRLTIKFLGESITPKQSDAILEGDPLDDADKAAAVQAKYAPKPAVGGAPSGKKPAARKPAARRPAAK